MADRVILKSIYRTHGSRRKLGSSRMYITPAEHTFRIETLLGNVEKLLGRVLDRISGKYKIKNNENGRVI